MIVTGLTLNELTDTLDGMRLRLDGQVPQNTDKEEFTIRGTDGVEVGSVYVNEVNQIELYGPRELRERVKEVMV